MPVTMSSSHRSQEPDHETTGGHTTTASSPALVDILGTDPVPALLLAALVGLRVLPRVPAREIDPENSEENGMVTRYVSATGCVGDSGSFRLSDLLVHGLVAALLHGLHLVGREGAERDGLDTV